MNTKTKKPTGEKLTTAELIKKAKPVSPSLPSGEGQGGVFDSSKDQSGVAGNKTPPGKNDSAVSSSPQSPSNPSPDEAFEVAPDCSMCRSSYFADNILVTKNAPRRSALRGSSLIKDGVHKGNHYEVFAGIDHQFTKKGQIIKPVIVLAIRDQAYLLNLDLLLDLATQLLPEKTWGGSVPSLPSGEGQGGVSSPGEVLIDMLEEQGKI